MALVHWLFWISTFCDGAAAIIVPIYLHGLGVSVATISMLFVITEVFGLLANLVSGIAANRLGYRLTMAIGFGLHIIASVGYLFLAPQMETVLLVSIISLLRAARGSGREAVKTIASACLKLQGGSYRYKFASIQLMFGSQEMVKGLGIGTGLAMLKYTSMPSSFFILGLLSALALILAIRKLSDHRETQVVLLSQIFAVKRNMKVLAYARALFYAGRDVWLVAALPIYLSHSGATNIELGMLMSASYIIYGASQPIGILIIKEVWKFRSKTVKRPWRFRNALIWLTLVAALIPAMAAWQSDNMDRFAFLILLAAVANGVLVTSHNHLHPKFAKKNRSSLDISYYKTIANLGKILAMACSGILYDRWSMEGCLYAASGILCLSAILTLRLRKPEDPSKRFLKQDALKSQSLTPAS